VVQITTPTNPYSADTLIAVRGNINARRFNPSYANLLFAQPRANAIKSEYYGFGAYDYQWTPGTITAPFPYYIVPVRYLLLEISQPSGSSNLAQNYNNKIKVNQFARLRRYGNEFSYSNRPIRLTFFGGGGIHYLSVKIYNPDHSLYQLHGVDWNITIIVTAKSLKKGPVIKKKGSKENKIIGTV
jgi:hypothetical protein